MYATLAHPDRRAIAGSGACLAVVIEITVRPAAGRYHYRAGEFQILLSHNHGRAGIPGLVVSGMVVVAEVIPGNNPFLKEDEIGII